VFGTGPHEKSGEEPSEFAAFVEASMEGLRLQTDGHQRLWGFGSEEEWEIDQEAGELVFTFPDKIVRSLAQIIGTFDGRANTWMWAWANDSIRDSLKRDSIRVRQYGQRHGVARLITPSWAGEELDGWHIAAVANRICQSNGAYRGPAGSTLVFMTFGEVQVSKR
jgi:hypothetical protein